MDCTHCDEKLNTSTFNSDKTLKSCPKCSTANGQQHVYHPWPAEFGTTDKRATEANPEGTQSYCIQCRTKDGVAHEGILCEKR